MKKQTRTAILILLLSVFLTYAPCAGISSAYAFSDQQLDQLLAPVALYPDPLLAVMLPAATYPSEITAADAWFQAGGTVAGIERQGWDESVKAVAYYPDIVKWMADNPDWMADLGDAFLNQPEDVAQAIQRLRWEARDKGNLESNDKQQVIIDGDTIKIFPAEPQTMYVPQYDPSVVYENSWVPGMPPVIFYGFGLPIGGWLCMDFDWRDRHVIYHGWNRSGWVNRAKPFIRVPNVYINRSRPFINQTWRHDQARSNPERFRASQVGRPSPGRPVQTPDARGRVTTSTRPPGTIFGPRGDTSSFSNRGKQSLGAINQRRAIPPAGTGQRPALPPSGVAQRPAPPAQGIVQRPSIPSAGIAPRQVPPSASITQRPAPPSAGITQRQAPPPASVFQRPSAPAPGIGRAQPAPPARESVQPPTAPSGAFGGYRGGSEARAQSLRGQSSRQSNVETRPSAPPASSRPANVETRPPPRQNSVESRPSASPAGRESAPVGRPGRR